MLQQVLISRMSCTVLMIINVKFDLVALTNMLMLCSCGIELSVPVSSFELDILRKFCNIQAIISCGWYMYG